MYQAKSCNGVFPLPETDSYTETDTDANGFNSNMQNFFHWPMHVQRPMLMGTVPICIGLGIGLGIGVGQWNCKASSFVNSAVSLLQKKISLILYSIDDK